MLCMGALTVLFMLVVFELNFQAANRTPQKMQMMAFYPILVAFLILLFVPVIYIVHKLKSSRLQAQHSFLESQ